MSTDSLDSESLAAVNKEEELPTSPSYWKFIIFIAVSVWVVAFFTVSYYCIESELHRQGLSKADTKQIKATTATATNNNKNDKENVQFQQSYQDNLIKRKKNHNTFHKFKERSSKLSSHESERTSDEELPPTRDADHEKTLGRSNQQQTANPVENIISPLDNNNVITELKQVEEEDISKNIQIQNLSSGINQQVNTSVRSNSEKEPSVDYNMGEVRSISSGNLCLDASSMGGSVVTLYECHGQGGNQQWEISDNDELKKEHLCADYFGESIFMLDCHGGRGNQQWIYSNQVLQHPISEKCLTVNDDLNEVMMKVCNDGVHQKWLWRKGYQTSHLLSEDNEL